MEIKIAEDIIKKIDELKNDDKELHEIRATINKEIRDIQGRLDKLEVG